MNKSVSLILASAFAAALALSTVASSQSTTDKPAAPKQDHKDGEKHEKKEEKKEEKKGDRAEIGKAAPAFTLKTADGKDWSLADAKGKIVVLEWINPNCPVCKRVMTDGTVASTIKQVLAINPNVVYVAINSSAADKSSLDGTAKYMTDNKMTIPALIDTDGRIGKLYGAKTTPHCYVIDSKGILRYQGAIDDNEKGGGAKMNYVVNAVKQINAGETVNPDSTKSYGCGVKY